ncbi:MAG: ribosomal L7Ae/L30e/S12e/Gadd45 family protein [Clostridiales bacterium]|nr:ribosomal L7Ae/L30e/S12e/Gadd45 family protein [Clostridiales bacterium]
MKRDKVLSLVGLAARAGKVVSGEFSTEKAVKSGKACLVLAAGDASENTKKSFRDMCAYYQVPLYFISDRENLGRAVGKEFRAGLAVQDPGLAQAVVRELEKSRADGT